VRRRSRLAQFSAVPLAVGAFIAPATAIAASSSSGGAGLGGSSNGGATLTSGATAQPTTGTVYASGGGITIVTTPTTLLRHKLTVTGTVAGAGGKVVEIERRATSGGSWLATTHGTAASNGAFTATWPTSRSGQFAVRAVVLGPNGPATGASASASPTSPSLTVTIYKPAIATTYGEGSWGSRTACGQTLRHATIGVANRTLPCGTKVSILWHNRTLVVPVIDRGPYANHADWDLTLATATALGIDGTETIGAVSVGH
jgi:rare lipoprotein A